MPSFPPSPPPEKGHSLFLTNPPLKIKVLSKPPFFENLLGGSTPLQKGGGCKLQHFIPPLILNINFIKRKLKIGP